MIIYGYAKEYKYSGDGTLLIRTRIPNIHGPYLISDYKGQRVRNYTNDADLPWYPSLLLPHLPGDGEVVAIIGTNDSMSSLLIIGLTGGSYNNGVTNL